MRVVFLGTAGYHPNEQRETSCVMLPEVGIILDAGSGMYRVRDRIMTDHLQIFLSHTHLDHVVGLTFLFDVLYQRSPERVDVYALPEKLSALRSHLLSEHIFPVQLPCNYHVLDAPVALARGGEATFFPLKHPGGSLGYRLQWPGHSLAYVTDTTASDDYLEQIRGVDLLIHECNFKDGQSEWAEKTGHSHTTPVAQLAARAGVKRLVLTHLNPLEQADDPAELAIARTIFPQTDYAYDGLEIEF